MHRFRTPSCICHISRLAHFIGCQLPWGWTLPRRVQPPVEALHRHTVQYSILRPFIRIGKSSQLSGPWIPFETILIERTINNNNIPLKVSALKERRRNRHEVLQKQTVSPAYASFLSTDVCWTRIIILTGQPTLSLCYIEGRVSMSKESKLKHCKSAEQVV